MGKCQIKECENEATVTLCRMTTDDERNEEVNEEGGLSWNYKVEAFVCTDHLELGQKEYPHVVNKEPYT